MGTLATSARSSVDQRWSWLRASGHKLSSQNGCFMAVHMSSGLRTPTRSSRRGCRGSSSCAETTEDDDMGASILHAVKFRKLENACKSLTRQEFAEERLTMSSCKAADLPICRLLLVGISSGTCHHSRALLLEED